MRFHASLVSLVVSSLTFLCCPSSDIYVSSQPTYDWDAKQDLLGVPFPAVGQAYTFPKNTPFYHGTPVVFSPCEFKCEPTWFSIRYDQSVRHGMEQFYQQVMLKNNPKWEELAKKEIQDGVSWEKDYLKAPEFRKWNKYNNPREKDMKTTEPGIFLYHCSSSVDLKLLYLNHDEPEDIKQFTAATDNQFAKYYQQLFNIASRDIIRSIKDSSFCKKWDGWRNPYDQDELMICPDKIDKVTCKYVEYFSARTLWSQCGMINPLVMSIATRQKTSKSELWIPRQQIVNKCALDEAYFKSVFLIGAASPIIPARRLVMSAPSTMSSADASILDMLNFLVGPAQPNMMMLEQQAYNKNKQHTGIRKRMRSRQLNKQREQHKARTA